MYYMILFTIFTDSNQLELILCFSDRRSEISLNAWIQAISSTLNNGIILHKSDTGLYMLNLVHSDQPSEIEKNPRYWIS